MGIPHPGAQIPAGGFVLVWMDGENGETTSNAWHANFRVGGATGVVALVSSLSNRLAVADHLRWTSAPADRAYGSWPDGDPLSRKLLREPTPRAPNDGTSPPPRVLVNEWLADNVACLPDPADGQYEDWFELYNPADDPMDLGGASLTDDLSNANKYRVPAGFFRAPKGFLLVWADGETGQNNPAVRPHLHAGFSLSENGEAIAVYDAAGRLVDAVVFGPQATDVSEGRYPDGAGSIARLPQATPAAPNAAPATNRPPRLFARAVQSVFRGGRIQFHATAEDDDTPAQTLTFTMFNARPAPSSSRRRANSRGPQIPKARRRPGRCACGWPTAGIPPGRLSATCSCRRCRCRACASVRSLACRVSPRACAPSGCRPLSGGAT